MKLKPLVLLFVFVFLTSTLYLNVPRTQAQVIFATSTPQIPPTATPTLRGPILATNTLTPTAIPPLLPSGIRLTGEQGTLFRLDQSTTMREFEGESAQNGLLLLIEGRFQTNAFRCLYGYNFSLVIDGTEYSPSGTWMEKLKPSLGIDYPRRDLAGQCMEAYDETPTFIVFDVPLTGKQAELRFFNGKLPFAWLSDLATPTPTASPTQPFIASTAPATVMPAGTLATSTQSADTLETRWAAVAGVTHIGMAFELGEIISGEICTADGFATQRTAEQLRAAAIALYPNRAIGFFSVILEDSAGAIDFIFNARTGQWAQTPLTIRGCDISSAG